MALTAALIGGAASLGAAGIGAMSRSGANPSGAVSQEQLDFQKQMLMQQMQQQALVNQRAVSGATDSFGTSVQYDPATNTWHTVYGKLPQQEQTAASQASILKNTTDLMQQELANRDAIRRAQLAGPAADAAIREISNYSPMSREALTGLLTNQAVTAARATYDPLRADTLRSIARTGSAGGPVLAELGRSEADNLRKSLIDAQIEGLSRADAIDQQRQAGKMALAGSAGNLATPNLGQTSINPSTVAQTMAQAVQQRAGNAAYTTPRGQTSGSQLDPAYANLIKNQSDPNFGLNQAVSGLKDVSQFFKTDQGNQAATWLGSLFGPSYGGANDAANYGSGNSGTWTDDQANLVYMPNQQGYTDTTSTWY